MNKLKKPPLGLAATLAMGFATAPLASANVDTSYHNGKIWSGNISDTKVLKTIVDGEVVYEAP